MFPCSVPVPSACGPFSLAVGGEPGGVSLWAGLSGIFVSMASDSVAQRSAGRAGNGMASLFFLLTAVSFATPLPLTA